MWLDSVAVLPLIMMGIERITEGKSGRLFGLSLFYGIWCSYYIGFMLCLFSCLYFLVRWISQKEITWKKIGRSCLAFGWYALLAGGMAALVLVPAYLGLSASQSMEGNSFPSAIQFYTDAKQLFESHLLFTTPINIANTQVGLNAYCGVATVLLAVLYLFDRKIRLRERLAHYGLCAFLLLSFSVNILNYIWHGFHVQNGLPNRFAFLYIAVLLVMAYDALGHLRTYRFWKLLAAWAVPAAFVAYSFWKLEPQTDAFPWYLTFGALLLYFGLLLLGSYAFQKRSLFSALLSAVVIIEVSANAIYGISQNGGVTRSIYLADQTSYQKLMKTQEDDSFFRSEVDRQRMRNVTMFAGGRSMVMFNSTMYSSVTDFFDSVGVEARMNKNGYLGVTKLLNDVLGIRYLASPSKVADTMYQFERLGEDGELALYKNDNALSLGFMVNDAIANWDITASEPLAVQNSFVQLATGHEPIFVLDRNIIMEDGQNYGIRIPEGKQVYLCIDTRVKNINLNTPEYSRSFDDYTDHLYVINGSDENDMADFTVTLKDGQENVTAHVYTCADSAYQEVVNALAKNPLTDVTADGNYVSGRLHADWDGTLLLTVPYDEGWKITVDGTQVEQFRIGEALTGIHVGAGDHEIEMKYTPPGLWIGSILSLLCAALYLLSGILEKKYGWYTESSTEAERREEMLTEKAPEETEPKAVRSENAVSKARVLEETMPKKTVSETADQEK